MSSPDKISQYLDQVCAQVRCREMHGEIREELNDHLQTMLDTAYADGLATDAAIEQAMARMGNPAEVGRNLDQAHRPRTDWLMLALVGCMVGFGLVATYILQTEMAMAMQIPLGVLLRPKLLWVALGCAVAGWLFTQDYRRLQRYSWHLFYVTLVCMLWALNSGISVNGQAQFVLISGLTINIYVIAPYLLVIAMAGILPRWNWMQPKNYLKLALLLIGPVLLFMVAPSFSSIIVYTLGFMAVALASGVRWPVVFGLAVALGLATTLIVTGEGLIGYLTTDKGLSNYRLQRLLIWLNPVRDPQGIGYMPLKVTEAIRTAGWTGQGIGSPLRMGLPLAPELAVTSMIHAFGILLGVLIALLAMGYVYRMIVLTKEIKEPYGRVMIIGLSTLFSCQLIMNLLMNGILGVSIASLFSVNIPFLAMSGSLFSVEMASVSLMLAAYRRKDMIPRTKTIG